MSECIQYAFRIEAGKETPCHLSEIKKDDVYYLVVDARKSELFKATDNAFGAEVNGKWVWSIPHVPCK